MVMGNKLNFEVFNWILEARSWRDKFIECHFKWVKRDCNKPADTLAKIHIPHYSLSFVYAFVPI